MVTHTGYRGVNTPRLRPLDGAPTNSPPEKYSLEVWRHVAIEASEGAFDEGVKTLKAFTGAHVPKRQFEGRVIRAAREFEASYADSHRRARANPPTGAPADGLPIATGVIEGTCRRLVQDRVNLTVARWSLIGTVVVLLLLALRAGDDLDVCWQSHEQQEHERNHAWHYPNHQVPEVVPWAALSQPSRHSPLKIVKRKKSRRDLAPARLT